MTNTLFILKRKEDYNNVTDCTKSMSTGLYNSASFMNDMLNDMGLTSDIVVVKDNNEIDKVVTEYQPKIVIIEALWIVPEKFNILTKLHPNVKWIIRVHSELPFLAGEGIAMNWLSEYSSFDNVIIACNAPRMLHEMRVIISTRNNIPYDSDKVIYLPNFYPKTSNKVRHIDKTKDTIDISLFGAVRPFKNHMVQAIAAIDFANKIGKKLRLHINAGRIEMNGGSVLSNLKALFEQLSESGHILVNHDWLDHDKFLEVCAETDIGLQVSFTETFNIVGADIISQGVPLVGSSEIPWLSSFFTANPTSSKEITEYLELAYNYNWFNVKLNQFLLNRYSNNTAKIWSKFFSKNI